MYAPSAAMSCVAPRKLVTQKKANVIAMKLGSFRQKATPASANAIASWVPTTQCFFVLNISVMGAHMNLNEYGAESEAVYSAISVFEMPRFLYISAATTPIVTLGKPSAKYSVGTQNAGWDRRAGGGTEAAASSCSVSALLVTLCMSSDRMELAGGYESKTSHSGGHVRRRSAHEEPTWRPKFTQIHSQKQCVDAARTLKLSVEAAGDETA